MTVDDVAVAGPPLAAMRGRLLSVPRPPRVDLPEPVPGGGDSSPPEVAPPVEPAAGQTVSTSVDLPHPTKNRPRASRAGARSSSAGEAEPSHLPAAPPSTSHSARTATEGLLAAAASKGFRRVVRDLYDDQEWDDGINMTWALPRAVRDTVGRFGVDAGLANKRAATTAMYLGLLQLGLDVRPNTPEEDRANRRRT